MHGTADRVAGPTFLTNGGEMGALLRQHNWSATPLGPVETWPQSLRVSLGICLGASTPIGIYWGEQLLLLYNDPFRQLIGDKHPQALGRPAREVFPEIWDTIGPMLAGVLATGMASASDSALLPLILDGKLEDRWFDFTANPIMGEGGRVEGVFNIAIEATARVRAERARLETERRLKKVVGQAGLSSDFRALFEAAPIPLLVLAPPDWTIMAANDARLQVTGTTREGVMGRQLFDAFPDDPDDPQATGVQNLSASLQRVLATKATDVMAVQRYAVRDHTGRFVERWWSPMNTPVLDEDGEVALVIHRVEEVTEIVRLRGEADAHDQLARDQQAVIDRLRGLEATLRVEREHLGDMFEQAPGFIAMLQGQEHRFTLANGAYRRLIGGRNVVGRSVREALPELEGQGFFELLDTVYTTGKSFRGTATPVRVVRDPGQPPEERLLDFVYQPVLGASGRVTGIFVEGSDVTDAQAAQSALRESEARYRQIVEGAEDLAIVTFDRQGTITGWNTGAERLTGRPDEDAIGQPGAILFTPEDRAAGQPDHEMNRAQEDGRAVDERWHQRKDGTRFWGSGLMMRMDQPGGGFLKIFRDRTAEHEAEAALRDSEERYRTLFTSIEAGFCVLEVIFDEAQHPVDYRFIEANPAFERQTGLINAVGRTAREMVPDLEQHWFDVYGQVALTGEPVRFENGSNPMGRWFEVRAMRVGKPEARRVALLFNDITEQRQRDERLRELNETLEERVKQAMAERQVLADVVDSTKAGILVCDLNYRILAINKSNAAELERVYGKRPRLGDHLLELIADMPEHQAQVARNWDRALAGEEFMIVEEFGDAAHERVSYEVRFNVLRDREGHRVGAFQTAYDVSDRVRAQAELEMAQEALRQAQKMEAVGQLTGGVAHDFNNLLTIIRSSAGLLRRPNLAEERRRIYMDAITDTVDRAARLTGQLLAFARRQALKPEVFDVAERVRTLDEMLNTILGGRIEVVTDIACDPCPVEADVSQFETAVVNMAVNARDAMDGEGRLTVHIEKVTRAQSGQRARGGSRPFIAVSLTDTGAGIPPEHLARIFEPFFTTKDVGKGTGLGLSQVYGFAKQSGGDVSVESREGHGTTFTLFLPHVDEARIPVAVEDRESTPAVDGDGRRVLVVEDNVEVGTFSTQVLNDLGYETTWVVNAQEALTRLNEPDRSFDVVFTDVVMPGMSGVELGEEIRRRHPGLPVVLTSGFSHVLADEGQHGFELLKKLYSAEDLSLALRRVSSSRKA